MKKGIAFLLVIVMVFALAACGNGQSADGSGTAAPAETQAAAPAETQAAAPAQTEAAAPAQTEAAAPAQTEAAPAQTEAAPAETQAPEAQGSGTAGVPWEDTEEIFIMYPSLVGIPEGLQDVEDAINEITEEEINTHVHIEIVDMGNYPQQVSLKMASGESFDLMMMGFASCAYAPMQSQNQLLDITDYLHTYAQDTLDLLGRFIEGTTANGRIYGVSGWKDQMQSVYWCARTDVLERLNLLDAAQNATTMAEITDILQAVKDSPDDAQLIPLAGTSDGNILFHTCLFDVTASFGTAECYDHLGDSLKVVTAGSDGKVMLTMETPEYRAIYDLVRDWYTRDFVHKDATTTTDMGWQLVQSGAAFSYFCTDTYGAENRQTVQCGMPITVVKVVDYPVTTSASRNMGWCVPSISQAPEAAVAFLNMMYTDERICNLLAWGIEGKDYQVANGEACYIEGNDTPSYHMNDFFFPNQFLTLPWQGSLPNIRQETEAIMKNCTFSDYMGFAVDTTDIADEVAAVTNVMDEYRRAVMCGMADEAQYNEFIEKLHAVGVDKIIDYYQEQLDAFLATR